MVALADKYSREAYTPQNRTARNLRRPQNAYRHLWLIALFFTLGTSRDATADQVQLPSRSLVTSESGRYSIEITPPRVGSDDPAGHCKATLFDHTGSEPRVVWSRFLINNRAPCDVFVSDSGEYVVTMDEWGQKGLLPVVVYGHGGFLKRVYNLQSLIGDDWIMKTRQTISNTHWRRNALTFFDSKENAFFIRLAWGEVVYVLLPIGYVQRWQETDWFAPYDGLRSFYDETVFKTVQTLLASPDPHDLQTGALVAGQRSLVDFVPQITGLLSNSAYFTKGELKIYYVRDAAKEALRKMANKKSEDVSQGKSGEVRLRAPHNKL
jgi:hypothetical protein